MEFQGAAGPVIVCLDEHHEPALPVQCGAGLARLWDAPLYLAVVVALPPQRPPGLLTEEEERAVNTLLDVAAAHALASGVVAANGIWIVRSWKEALHELPRELRASAVVIGWRSTGPFGLFDAGRTLLKTSPCPILMVGGGTDRPQQASWPPRWLAEAHLSLSE